jgi:hypothetical protein
MGCDCCRSQREPQFDRDDRSAMFRKRPNLALKAAL